MRNTRLNGVKYPGQEDVLRSYELSLFSVENSKFFAHLDVEATHGSLTHTADLGAKPIPDLQFNRLWLGATAPHQ